MNTSHPFSIKAVLKLSWKQLAGAKWPIWAPILVLMAITFGVNFVASFVFGLLGFPFMEGSFTAGYSVVYLIIAFIIEIITLFLTAPLIAGAFMAALKQVHGESIQTSTAFHYWPMWVNLGITVLLISLGSALINVVFGALISVSYSIGLWLTLILQILAIIAFIIFYSFYLFSIFFVADRQQGPIEALSASVNMVRPCWLHVSKIIAWIAVGMLIVSLPFYVLSHSGLVLLSLLGALISAAILIWALPYFFLIVATVFDKLSNNT